MFTLAASTLQTTASSCLLDWRGLLERVHYDVERDYEIGGGGNGVGVDFNVLADCK